MFPVLQVGPLALRTPGLLLLLGITLGLSLAERHATRRNIIPDHIYNLTFIALIVGVLGARLSFAVQHYALFRESPLNLISLDLSLLDPFGGLALALIAALVYGQRKKLHFWPVLDEFTPMLAVFGIFIGLANLASGKAFGAVTSLPWGIDLWGANRHPSQVYETVAALIILALLWRQFRVELPPGKLILQFLASSAAARLLLEAFRGDSILMPGGIRLAQVLAWIILAGCLWLLDKKTRTPHNG
jgi:phosphatidylglycerol---prolipoprotein diacylglyceryl transferase